MMLRQIAVTLSLLLSPTLALGHGAPPPAVHGGIVAESSSDQWVELVIRGDQVAAYVMDQDGRPVPSTQLGGKATVLAAGKRDEVTLTPGEGNSLTGTLAAPAPAKVTAVLQLMVGGKPAMVRFAIG